MEVPWLKPRGRHLSGGIRNANMYATPSSLGAPEVSNGRSRSIWQLYTPNVEHAVQKVQFCLTDSNIVWHSIKGDALSGNVGGPRHIRFPVILIS